MRRPLQLLLLFSFWCCSAELATAQLVLDPGFLEFTASADHSAVERYEFLLYTVGSSTPLRVVNLGKPAPDSAGTIRVALNTILVPLPAGGIEYEVRIAAIGSNGSSASTPSNTFAYQLPCTYSVSPTSQSIARVGGSASFAVTTSAGCSWSASEQSSWISIASGESGSGGGTVRFTVAANTGTSSRSTSATIAGRTVTISQPGIGTAPAPPTGFRIVTN